MRAKKLLTMVLAAALVLTAGKLSVSASTHTGTVNDIGFTAYTYAYEKNATVGTVSSSGQVQASYDATYYYTDAVSGSTRSTGGSISHSATATAAASYTFSVPSDKYVTASITANHTATSGGYVSTCHTSAIYNAN